MTSRPPHAVNGHHHHHHPHRHSHDGAAAAPPHNHHNHHHPPPPPPNFHFPHHHSSSSSSKASFKGCCCCLFLLFSLIFLIVLAVILVVVLAVKPKKPQFDLQSVGVQYLGISPNPNPNPTTGPTTSSTASVSLAIRMLFTAANDNKVGIKYGESKFTVMYRGIPLGRGIVPGFYQPAHSVRQVQTTIAVDRVNLLQADASDLIRDATVNDRVELRVVGDVGAKIRILGFTSPGVQVSVDCAIVISPRKQALTSKQCGFDGLSV
ncbi:OLC1v1002521C1 [Oldenlandia corymbosa var. corymbosa]|uniref:OLC1v1002521C1 n=1 Tax=Oldenlandia corymbosa var. corymbosa TaxID=529605 RepID=A0AAV1D9G3_OLDCO|nr:OLC1v1002521C1 [Oldenlandia corymbosa var. corymbosa]